MCQLRTSQKKSWRAHAYVPGISTYASGISRLPRYVRLCTYVCTRATSNQKKQNIMPSKRSGCHTRTAPGLHPKTKKEQNAQHTLTERHTHRDRQRFELVPKNSWYVKTVQAKLSTVRSKLFLHQYENNTHEVEQALPAWRCVGRSSRGTRPLLSEL